jgi:hypothetical protein
VYIPHAIERREAEKKKNYNDDIIVMKTK